MTLLSFDIEEFDMPLEYQGHIPFEEQIAISQNGLIKILDLLKKHNAKATFFSTVVFAEHSKELIKRLLHEGHELASHTYYHSQFTLEDLEKSRLALEQMFATEVIGLRMPRMMPVPTDAVQKAGYLYNSSVNPTWLPGRYDNRHVSRTHFMENEVLQIPASVTPNFRIPLFWLSFHNFPQGLYHRWASDTLNKDGYLNLYFHPWEFSDIAQKKYQLPSYTTRNVGEKMVKKFDKLLSFLTAKGEKMVTFKAFRDEILAHGG